MHEIIESKTKPFRVPETDGYRIDRLLIEGGMSVLYAGTDLETDLPVAIKSMKPSEVQDPEKRKRFIKEISTANRLLHPNIVKIISSGEDQNHNPYLVMELLKGRSLGDELLVQKKIELEQALEWLLPIFGALGYAHDNGVVHRDVKPSNIFLHQDENGLITPKLLDFGVSLLSDTSRCTNSGSLVGTLRYMSPEQIYNGEVGPSTDVWSMGVVLYQCLTGKTPFEADTTASILYKIVNVSAPSIINQISEIGPRIAVSIDRALRKDISQRYLNIREFARGLCMTSLREGNKLPESPDPIGLPEWHQWMSSDIEHTNTKNVTCPLQLVSESFIEPEIINNVTVTESKRHHYRALLLWATVAMAIVANTIWYMSSVQTSITKKIVKGFSQTTTHYDKIRKKSSFIPFVQKPTTTKNLKISSSYSANPIYSDSVLDSKESSDESENHSIPPTSKPLKHTYSKLEPKVHPTIGQRDHRKTSRNKQTNPAPRSSPSKLLPPQETDFAKGTLNQPDISSPSPSTVPQKRELPPAPELMKQW